MGISVRFAEGSLKSTGDFSKICGRFLKINPMGITCPATRPHTERSTFLMGTVMLATPSSLIAAATSAISSSSSSRTAPFSCAVCERGERCGMSVHCVL
jgi:hypothetical protein